MDISKSKKTIAVLDEAKDFLSQSTPRTVPDNLLKSAQNRFVKALMIFCGIFLVFQPALFVIIAIANKTTSFGPGVIPAYVVYFLLLCVVVWATTVHRRTKGILSNGRAYEGKIVKIGGLPLRMPSTQYNYVTVEFTDEHGETHKVWDAIETIAVDYFYSAYSNDEDVAVIFSPTAPRNAVLLMKIPYQTMFLTHRMKAVSKTPAPFT